jgi:hypothetical protein
MRFVRHSAAGETLVTADALLCSARIMRPAIVHELFYDIVPADVS